jgi:CO/xanthine dehydrogenase FAD-binding subunit
MIQDYYCAKSVSDALSALKESQGQARIIAGGTDLLLDIAEEKKHATKLVDITQIPELREITLEENFIRIGAAVTHTQITQSPYIQKYFPALAAASGKVGSLQIRNVSTLVGNIINAQPAADGALALSALEARIEILSEGSLSTIPIDEAYLGVGKSSVNSHEHLVTDVLVPLPQQNQSSAFIRLDQRKALALPMLNVAVNVILDSHKEHFKKVTIVMAPVGPKPARATEAEDFLQNSNAPVTPDTIAKAAQLASKEANPRTSLIRGSREYRLDVLPVLVKRALDQAVLQIKHDNHVM